MEDEESQVATYLSSGADAQVNAAGSMQVDKKSAELKTKRVGHSRSVSQASSSTSTKKSGVALPMPHCFFIEFDSQGKVACKDQKIYEDKRQATFDVKACLQPFLETKVCVGSLRKVTLHRNKRSLYVWVDDATEASVKSLWLPFCKDFATSMGSVTQLSEHAVLVQVQFDAAWKKKVQTLKTIFAIATSLRLPICQRP